MKKLISLSFKPLIITGLMFITFNVSAVESSAAEDDWEFKAGMYLWMSSINGTAPTGGEIDAEFSTIIEKLDFAFMGGIQAHRGKWAVFSDIFYVRVSDGSSYSVNVPSRSPTIEADLDLQSWAVNLAAGRQIIDNEKHSAHLLAGVRYYSLDVDLGLNLVAQLGDRAFTVTEIDSVIDPIVGIKGEYQFNDKWFVPYHFDVGGGMSNFTTNIVAGVGYRYEWGNFIAGYRYLHYDFSSDFDSLRDIDMHGPLLAGQWLF